MIHNLKRMCYKLFPAQHENKLIIDIRIEIKKQIEYYDSPLDITTITRLNAITDKAIMLHTSLFCTVNNIDFIDINDVCIKLIATITLEHQLDTIINANLYHKVMGQKEERQREGVIKIMEQVSLNSNHL